MAIKKHNRQYDLVVLGATGYTGLLTAEHIAKNLPTNLKWAVAGRSETKLQTTVESCKELDADRQQPAIELANVNDEAQITALVKKTCTLISTVGPYCMYGEVVFKACAESGTHYFDCTGEVPWVARMIKKYEKKAQESGAIMLPQIGIESSPPDLCTWSLATCLREQLDAKTKDARVTIHKLSSTPSGGTLATALSIFDHFPLKEFGAAGAPYALSPAPHPELARPKPSILQMIFGVHTIPNLGMVTTSVAGMTDIPVVERTWGLLSTIPSRKDQFYGSRFNWAESYKVRNWLHGVAVHWALLVGGFLLAFVSPFRTLMKKLVFQPGQGPAREDMDKEEIEYRGVAIPDTETPSTKQAFCRAWFHGSMYCLTGVFLAQAALTVLEDDIELDGGVYTPACLGQGFIDRADKAGFKMEVRILDS